MGVPTGHCFPLGSPLMYLVQFSGTQQPQPVGRPLLAPLIKKTPAAQQVPNAEVHPGHPTVLVGTS